VLGMALIGVASTAIVLWPPRAVNPPLSPK
jgi:hypothetical protein